MKHLKGFTLIDLMLALGIAAILFNIALPSFAEQLKTTQVDAEVEKLHSLLQLAKNSAVSHAQMVTVCPSSNGKACEQDWSKGYMAFVDENSDRQLNQNDRLLRQEQLDDGKISLAWKAFGVRSSLQWAETGITNHQNGSFYFCYPNQARLSRGLYVTKSGRLRQSQDSDQDGLHESAAGDQIPC